MFESVPAGAKVVLDNGRETVTPGVIDVDKFRPHSVTFHLEGHAPKTVRLYRSIHWYVLGDVFVGIVPGLIIDYVLGGAFALEEKIVARLVKLPPSEVPAPEAPAPPPDEAPALDTPDAEAPTDGAPEAASAS